MDTRPLCPWDSPGKNTGVGCGALLQGIFPTPGVKPLFLKSPALAGVFVFLTTSTTWEAWVLSRFKLQIPHWNISFLYRYISKTCCCQRPKRMGHHKRSSQGEWSQKERLRQCHVVVAHLQGPEHLQSSLRTCNYNSETCRPSLKLPISANPPQE